MKASRWRPTPGRLFQLVFGLGVFGVGEGLVVEANLGNSPWTAFAEGLANRTALSIGAATIVSSFAILLAWVPLRQRPGLGTVLNAVEIGLAIDFTLWLVPGPAALGPRIAETIVGTGLVGLGSGYYLTAALGPGPRDGLMVGLHRLTGVRVGTVRTVIEVSALAAGWLLGGTVGLGTVFFAVAVGPAVAFFLRRRGADPGAL